MSIRYGGILRLSLHELADVLQRAGYRIASPLPPRPYRGEVGGAISPLAHNNVVAVDVNTERQVVGLTAISLDHPLNKFIEELEKIEKLIKEDLRLKAELMFYEVIAELRVETGKNPLETFNNIASKCAELSDVFEKVAGLTKQEVTLFNLRLRSKSYGPNDYTWLDLEVMPSVARPEIEYLITIVYRDQNIDRMRNLVTNIYEISSSIIKALELKAYGKTT